MFSPSFRQRKMRPPDSKAGFKLWDLAYFFLVFPLSSPANRALYAWVPPGAMAVLALPLVACILLVQLASTMLGLLAIIMFGTAGSLFAMNVYGACPHCRINRSIINRRRCIIAPHYKVIIGLPFEHDRS